MTKCTCIRPRTFRRLEEQHYKTCIANNPEGIPFEGCKILLGMPDVGKMLPTACERKVSTGQRSCPGQHKSQKVRALSLLAELLQAQEELCAPHRATDASPPGSGCTVSTLSFYTAGHSAAVRMHCAGHTADGVCCKTRLLLSTPRSSSCWLGGGSCGACPWKGGAPETCPAARSSSPLQTT